MTLFDKFLRIRELGIFSIIVVFVIVAAIIDPRFMTMDSWRAVFLAIPLILVMAMGQMMVIICRHVDISIGSILAFSAIVIGLLFFLAVGYFAYTFGQCVAKFSRLDKLINKKVFGVAFLALYINYVYTNQAMIIDVFMAPLR